MHTFQAIGDEAAALRSAAPEGARATSGRVPEDVLAAALALSLWVTFGSLVLAVVDGLGADPQRRLAVGVLLVAVGVLALVLRRFVCDALRVRPWLVVWFAGAALVVFAIDGFVGGPFVAASMTPIGIAVVAARSRTVWLCVVVLAGGYACGVLLAHQPGDLADDGRLGGVIGTVIGYPVAAALLLGLRYRFTRFVANVAPTLQQIRAGAPASTAALQQAVRGGPIALLPAPPSTPLTPRERAVVEALAAGQAPKQIAYASGVSIHTVRSQIASAKRKTGARTLRELVVLAAQPGPDLAMVDEY